MISLEGLEEFKQIIFEDYGIKLSDQQAYQDAIAFLEAFKILVNNSGLIQKQSIDTQSKEDVNVS